MILKLYFSIELNLYTIFNSYTNIIGKEIKYMKKQEAQKINNTFNKQIKILCKQFKFLDQHYIRLLFQFCQYDAIRTYKVLQMIKDIHIPASFIKKLVDNPNQSDKYISQKQNQYTKKYGYAPIDAFQSLNEKQDAKKNKNNLIDPSMINFFQQVPKDVCGIVMTYLDPYSFSQFSQINKKVYNISVSEALHFYFKNLCLKLFKNQKPQLPNECRFNQIKTYVQLHPTQFGPNIVHAVTNNLRYYVWKSEPNSFKVETNYYKSFGSYRNVFLYAPRVHFNGVYVCKHKYVKIGEKGFVHSVTPIHVIYYYRYIRFFEDGSLLCCISSNKVKKEELAKRLSYQNLMNFNPNNNEELKIGEYMQFKDTLYVKIVRCNTIFNYQLKIGSNQSKVSDQLMVMNYTLELVDQREIVQKLYEYKQYKQKMLFCYMRNQFIGNQNSDTVKAISL